MKKDKPAFYVFSAVAATGVSLIWLWNCVPEKPAEKTAAGPTAVTLLSEDQVRLSNDPQKTEPFRDAGLGIFFHWGPTPPSIMTVSACSTRPTAISRSPGLHTARTSWPRWPTPSARRGSWWAFIIRRGTSATSTRPAEQ